MAFRGMADDKTIIADTKNLTILSPQNKRRTACFIQYSGTSLGKRYIIDEPAMVLGRSPETEIHIDEMSVSRKHARCLMSDDRIEIEDLGSSNGTYVNDKKVAGRVSLKDGDIIRLGTILLKFFATENIDALMHDKIYRMATIDAGTQIFNKAYLNESLNSQIKFAKTYGKDLSIIIYDLDHFKKVNDTYGHNAGDYILKETARIVKASIRKEDIIGRFGGEEFVVILPNTDARIAYEFAERIRGALENTPFTFELNSPQGKQRIQHRQTISVGVSQLTPDMPNKEALLESADKKLYVSKQSGRNRVTV